MEDRSVGLNLIIRRNQLLNDTNLAREPVDSLFSNDMVLRRPLSVFHGQLRTP